MLDIVVWNQRLSPVSSDKWPTDGETETCGCCQMPVCPAPTVECEVKAGYASVAYLPFLEPSGSASDLVPTLYQTRDTVETLDNQTGTAGYYIASEQGTDPWESDETLRVTTGTATSVFDWTWTVESNDATGGYYGGGSPPAWNPPTCVHFGPDGILDPPVWVGDIPWVNDARDSTTECTETVRTEWLDVKAATDGSPQSLQGCPGPFGNSGPTWWWDITWEDSRVSTLTDPVTPEGLIALAAADAAAQTSWSPGSCYYSVVLDWPEIGEVGGGTWPACGNSLIDFYAGATADVTIFRYRVKVPEAHAGTWFLIEWDEVWFPAGGTPEVTAREFEWTGGDRESEWFAPDPPAYGGSGELRLCNVRYACYRAPWGTPVHFLDTFETYEL
jgi:hypothetical protein